MKTFADYVSEETILRAGFNWWETSLVFNNCTACVAYRPERNLNIVVIEEREGTCKRKRWYFGVYNGPEEISDEQMKQIYGMVTRRNRVAGRNLEKVILQVLDTEQLKV